RQDAVLPQVALAVARVVTYPVQNASLSFPPRRRRRRGASLTAPLPLAGYRGYDVRWRNIMPPRLGFIGLGLMGKPMATRLLEAGYTVGVHKRSHGAVRDLAGRGAIACTTSREVAERAEVVITMLPEAPDVELVLLGEKGVLEGAAPGSIVIDMTTNNPEDSARLAAQLRAKQVGMLDAPVSGGDVGARNGTLSIISLGPPDTFQASQPIFKS